MVLVLKGKRARRALEMFEAGEKYAAIAGELGVSVGALAGWFNRRGLRRKKSEKTLPPGTLERAVELRREGLTYRRIGAMTGCSPTMLRRVFAAAGLVRPAYRGRRDEIGEWELMPEPVAEYPPTDTFELSAEQRRRLEEVRERHRRAWRLLYGPDVEDNSAY